MKVIVTETAFYAGARRRPGTTMTLPDETKGTWFKVVPEPKADKPAATGNKSKATPGKAGDDADSLV